LLDSSVLAFSTRPDVRKMVSISTSDRRTPWPKMPMGSAQAQSVRVDTEVLHPRSKWWKMSHQNLIYQI
jgi:hypothetical protein